MKLNNNILSAVLLVIISIATVSAANGNEVLTLQRAIQFARDNNPVAKALSSETDAAKAGVVSSRSGFLPNVEAYGTVSRYMKKPGMLVPAGEIGNANEIGLQTSEQTVPTTGVVLKQTIYDFGRTSSQYNSAKAEHNIRSSAEDVFLKDLSVSVTKSYLDVLMLREAVVVAKNSLAAYSSHLRTAQQMFSTGMISRNDLLSAEIAKSKAELEVTSESNKQQVSELSFEKLVGIKPEHLDASVLSVSENSGSTANLDAAISSAKERRPELDVNRAQQQLATARKNGAASQYLPRLVGEARVVYTDDKYQLNKDQYYFGVGLSVPIFDGLRAYGERNRAKSELVSAKMNQQNIMDQIEIDVTNASLSLSEAKRNVPVSIVNEAKASENLRMLQERYAVGDAPASEVLDAIALWKSAKLSVVEAKCSAVLAQAYLTRAKGEDYVSENKK